MKAPMTRLMKRAVKHVVLLAVLFTVTRARAEDRVARIYEIGKTGGEAVFVQKIHTEKSGDEKSPTETRTSTINDSEGKTVMTEVAVYDGLRLISQNVSQAQVGLDYEVVVEDGKVFFREFKTGENAARSLVTEKSETIRGAFLTGPLSENFIRAHWDELVKGDEVRARFGVLELGETVGFAFKRKALQTVDGRELLVLEMRPSSFFISILVDPIELSFDVIAKNLARYKGRTPLTRKVDGKSKPFDAEITYK